MDPAKYNTPPTEATAWGWELGLAWEDVALRKAFLRRLGFPGAVELQKGLVRHGIHMTPDAVDIPGRRIYEAKLTRFSSRESIDSAKLWHWRVQAQAYLHALDLNTAVFPVMHLAGDYGANREFTVAVWEVEFTNTELRKNWQMILNAKEDMEGKADVEEKDKG